MTVTVLLFAAARDRVNAGCVEVAVETPATVAAVQAALLREFPQLEPMAGTLLWAVNSRYAIPTDDIVAGDTVACFPPVSGG